MICYSCDRQINGAPLIHTDPVPNSDGEFEARTFCASECLQKHRVRTMQSQKAKKCISQPRMTQPPPSTTSSTGNGACEIKLSLNQKDVRNYADAAVNGSRNTRRTTPTKTPNATTSALTPKTIKELPALDLMIQDEDDLNNNDLPPVLEPHDDLFEENPMNSSPTHSTSSLATVATGGSGTTSQTDKPKSARRVGRQPIHHYETFGTFVWDEYLEETGGVPAPKSCFKQSDSPPSNDFEVNTKLEARDPRNPSSVCIGTVVFRLGPRIQIRLDGTDNSNDFWELVDSGNIKPIGTCVSQKGMLQPPLGFQRNPSQFHIFVANTLQGKLEADPKWFKTEPDTPPDNLFEPGMKLEAVDRKNPRLICPATVGEVKENKLQVQFDGWQGAFDYWTTYDSRDIFPVGYCKAGGHPLQPPGDKVHDLKKKGATPKYIMATPLMAAASAQLHAEANQPLPSLDIKPALPVNNGAPKLMSTPTVNASTANVCVTSTPTVNKSASKRKLITTSSPANAVSLSETPLSKIPKQDVEKAKTLPNARLNAKTATSVATSSTSKTIAKPLVGAQKQSATVLKLKSTSLVPATPAQLARAASIPALNKPAPVRQRPSLAATRPTTSPTAFRSMATQPSSVSVVQHTDLPEEWDTEGVIHFLVTNDRGLEPHANTFREHVS